MMWLCDFVWWEERTFFSSGGSRTLTLILSSSERGNWSNKLISICNIQQLKLLAKRRKVCVVCERKNQISVKDSVWFCWCCCFLKSRTYSMIFLIFNDGVVRHNFRFGSKDHTTCFFSLLHWTELDLIKQKIDQYWISVNVYGLIVFLSLSLSLSLSLFRE
jgi:hypothetical protein